MRKLALSLCMTTQLHAQVPWKIQWTDHAAASRIEVHFTDPAQAPIILQVTWLGLASGADEKSPQPVIDKPPLQKRVYHIGRTTFTRSLWHQPDRAWLCFHLLADQPGDLSFRVNFLTDGNQYVPVAARKQISSKNPAGGFVAHLSVLPFEIEPKVEGSAIAVEGEGEALLFLAFSNSPKTDGSLARTWPAVFEEFRAADQPNDLSKWWRGLRDFSSE